MSFRSHAAVDPGDDEHAPSSAVRGLQPDDMVLRRSAFDFLQSKGVIPSDSMFTKVEAQAILETIDLDEYGRPSDNGTELCLFMLVDADDEESTRGGPTVVFDDKHTVLAYRSDSDAEMIRCHERLNVAERMELIAFPVLCLDDESKRPVKRTRHATQASISELIPDACALQILAYAVNMQDFIPIMLVCKHWRNLLNESRAADEAVWKPLCLRYYPTLLRVHESLHDEADITLQKLFLDQVKCVKERFRPHIRPTPSRERHILMNDSFDSDDEYYDEVDESFQSLDFTAYKQEFTLVLRQARDDSIQVKVEATLGDNGMIGLELPSDLNLSTCSSLAIYFQHPIKEVPCLLYSGTIDQSGDETTFDSYNRFEKWHARSFFVGLCRRNHAQRQEKSRIAIPSAKLFLVNEKTSSFLKIVLSWQTENDGTGFPMSRRAALIFLETGMSAADVSPLLTTPASEPEHWAVVRFSPHPLSSYGFLIDFRLDVEDILPCSSDIISRYYEPSEFFAANPRWNWFCLNFDIPSKCQGMIPSGEAQDGKLLDISVYAIDKASGRQALLYEGSNIVEPNRRHSETEEAHHRMQGNEDFECFDASTFFSGWFDESQNYGSIITATPSIYPESAVLRIQFWWTFHYGDGFSGGTPVFRDEILTFLEKGLAWK